MRSADPEVIILNFLRRRWPAAPKAVLKATHVAHLLAGQSARLGRTSQSTPMGVTTYTVSQSRQGWEIDRSGTLLGLCLHKEEAIAFATVDAQRAAKSGATSQVVVVEGIT